MERALYSPSWYRVAALRPQLRGHVRIHRQQFRGGLWYVLQDRASGRYHRFTPAAHFIIGLMDGRRTVQEIWDISSSRLGDEAVTQDEMIRLLSQLHQSDVLHSEAPDVEQMSERAHKQRVRKRVASFVNPMAIRVPLIDPDEFLAATLPLARPLLSWFGAALFVGLVGYGVILTGMHWDAITGNFADRVMAADSLIALFVAYPVVKALHELGHGYAVKRWGGEVHEMGVMLLVFMPVPYVDASAAAAFRDKWRRALVGAAGIMVELALAAVALIVWLNTEPGAVHTFAFSVMLIGGISTLLFNGNPLLRFDGYYVLGDVLEIPNLGVRANRYIGYLIQRHLFGVRDAVSPATARGEPAWLFAYAIASFAYRIAIAFVIILFVASKFFMLGILLAIWGAVVMLLLPLGRQIWFLLTSPILRQRRGRALAVTSGTVALIAIAVGVVPLPHATVTQGVVWTQGEAAVHAGAEGTVARLLAPPNAVVRAQEPLILLEDPFLDAEVQVLEARRRELMQRYDIARIADPVEARIHEEQARRVEAALALRRQKQADLVVRSPSDGQFIVPRPAELIGRFVRKGDHVGYVASFDQPIMQVIVPEDSAGLVRERTRSVEVRLVERVSEVLPAIVVREIPSVGDKLPSRALSTLGGGDVVIDPRKPEEMKALSKVQQLELRFERHVPIQFLGGRIHVRFYHGEEPLVNRVYRSLRQVFLRQLNV